MNDSRTSGTCAPTLDRFLRRQVESPVIQQKRGVIPRRQIRELRHILTSQLCTGEAVEMGPHNHRSHELLILPATFHNRERRLKTGFDLNEASPAQSIRGTLCVLIKPGRREARQIWSKWRVRGKPRHPLSQPSDICVAATLRLQPATGAE